MRKQQINLYQPIFRKQHVAFSFQVMLIILSVALFAMGSLYGLSKWHSVQLKQQYASLQAQNQSLETNVASIAERMPVPQVNKLLESELKQLVDKRKTGFALLNTLQMRIAANKEGFSGYFEGLARQTIADLWFTQVAISEAGAHLSLKGKTLQPEGVPQLLKKLEDAPAFTGKNFQVVELLRPEGLSDPLDFSLMTAVRSKEQ
ncbi:PilN domain-containing protein [Sedimenticola selenatireducens]|uniref:PilN domain-containing protein n=1 Tax=Sedimenticola selenatireducens TaxID=191960 RepID=A0A558DRX3_9GAMM|nr:PilN domain-containing protein [Sedimenticola selenatireducens]TVO75946.1 PilN domain-containing protein [Sedimenticola selenatireducens]TVT63805.1 MAG: PilN domain-containing protein [Sedimenticola selenatireducens]